MEKERNMLKEAIVNPYTFCVTWEQIAGRGAFEKQQEEIFKNAQTAARGGRIHGISVTDNPSGNPAFATEMLCADIKKLGIEPLVHLALRDKNRNEIESLLYGMAAAGVRNLLVLSGDYPSECGFGGMAKPVFDLDPTHVIQLVQKMNNGLEYEALGKQIILSKTDFFAGVAVSPFKKHEAELMGQYYKLSKKLNAGADYVVSQVGYDARKMHELIQWLKSEGYNVPVLANIYVLSYPAARLMNGNQIPGCVVTDKLVAQLVEERQAEDKGKEARLLRAAKMYAIAKGMGFAGAHIGGHGLKYEMVEYILDKGEELLSNWFDLVDEFHYSQQNGFYFFKQDKKTGLNSHKPVVRPLKPPKQVMYSFYRIVHGAFFEPQHPFFVMYQRLSKRADVSRWIKKLVSYFEHLAKVALFGCQNCGDCALFDVAYICPMSQCPKSQRLGPCGGSFEGWCEVYPDEKKCVWVRAYERLKAYKEEDSIGAYTIPPCNWELRETSSWLNFYLGRDHTAERLGVKPTRQKAKKK
ncbi:MAG: methylenetetrahydrofolate reductase C-terminal domain-containing protein [Dehalococcoidia bacterium]|nr:MAG: methylenetetrahydrofolate reductase C-terminal domain-containing protein [Dehalococcoidia bacterium]